MKILHLIPALSGGGAERQLSYLAPELARMGHEVHVAYSNEGHQKPELPGFVLFFGLLYCDTDFFKSNNS